MRDRRRNVLVLSACALALACGVAPVKVRAAAETVLLGLDHTRTTGRMTVVKLSFSREPGERPRVLLLHHPAPWLVLDFAGAATALADPRREIDERDLRAVRVVQADGRLRVMLRLARPLAWEIGSSGSAVLVTLFPG